MMCQYVSVIALRTTIMQDNALLEAISRCPLKEDGSIQWVAVSCELGGSRTYEQCCNRYRHHLKYREWPVNNGQWADNEVTGELTRDIVRLSYMRPYS